LCPGEEPPEDIQIPGGTGGELKNCPQCNYGTSGQCMYDYGSYILCYPATGGVCTGITSPCY
jgi:hypothetical protein